MIFMNRTARVDKLAKAGLFPRAYCYDAPQRQAATDVPGCHAAMQPKMITTNPAETKAATSVGRTDAPRAGISLRLKINLIFLALTVLVFLILIRVEVSATRDSVREEMEASSRIATQLLARISSSYVSEDLSDLIGFLQATGRIRANEIALYDKAGMLRYQSPPSVYKAGRDAPQWYASLVSPPEMKRVIMIGEAQLVIATNPTRAILDGWDNLRNILLAQLMLFVLADIALFWLIGQWVAPLEKIERGLSEIERGDHQVRLPPLPGKEAGQMGRTFNRMAQAVEDNIQVRQASAEAQARLEVQREFTKQLHARIEEERAALALELHDELGQSLTAIRSIAKSMMQRPEVAGGPLEQHAKMLFDTAGMTSDAMHRMIPRLRPIKLEGMGLVDAVRDLLTETQQNNPDIQFNLKAEGRMPALDEALELSAYRIIQEAVTNIVRHAGATRAHIGINSGQGQFTLVIADNGRGAPSVKREGHYGVRGMQERAESHGGTIVFKPSAEGGLEVVVSLPIKESHRS
jgi:two-component system sensor histidine kinase UhpB